MRKSIRIIIVCFCGLFYFSGVVLGQRTVLLNLTSVSVVNDTTVVIVGEHGTLLRSTDAGRSWVVHHLSDSNFSSVSFLKETGAINVTNGHMWFETTNGGDSWQLHNNSNYDFIFPVGESILMAEASSRERLTRFHALDDNLDSFPHWSYTDPHSYPIQKYGLATSISKEGLAVIAGNGMVSIQGHDFPASYILVSTDSGLTWSTQLRQSGFSGIFWIYQMDLTPSGRIVASGIDPWSATANTMVISNGIATAPQNWTTRSIAVGLAFACVNDSIFLAAGDSGKVYRSIDTCGHWDSVYLPTKATFRAIASRGNLAVTVGDSGYIFCSHDYGLHWTESDMSEGVCLPNTVGDLTIQSIEAKEGHLDIKYVASNSTDHISVRLLDLLGRVESSQEEYSAFDANSISLPYSHPGFYILQLSEGSQTIAQKVAVN